MADTPGTPGGSGGRFSALLLEGLDHYRKGRMLEAVRAWEEAYLLEPTNLRAREFLRSALERIHAHMGPKGANGQPQAPAHPWLPATPPATPQAQPEPTGSTQMFAAPPLVWAVEGRSNEHANVPGADHVRVARLLIAAGSPLEWTPPDGAPSPERTLEGLISLRRDAGDRGSA